MKRRQPLPRKTFFELPPLELECMKALWAQGEASVRDIRAHLNGANGRGLAYTTIETIMDRLARKGVVTRRKVGRAHLYTPLYEAAAARADAVAVLVHHFFAGSRRQLAAYLAGEPLPASLRPPLARPADLSAGLSRAQPREASAKADARAKSDRPPPVATRKPAAPKPQPSRPARPIDTSLL
jgi:predicted transcriptional regulator